MTLTSRFSTEQMHKEWIDGTPISEIVKKTGIKRKTWNKRFERFAKRVQMAKNNNFEVINGDNYGNVAVKSSEKSQIRTNVPNHDRKQIKTNTFIAALVAMSIMIATYFIYVEVKKIKSTVNQ